MMENERAFRELGEALFAGLTAGSPEDIEPLLDEDVSFQHHPLPATKGKAAVLKVTRQIAKHTDWSLVERHSTLADE